MSPLIGVWHETVDRLTPVQQAERAGFLDLPPTRDAHAGAHAQVRAFRQIELQQPTGAPAAGPLRVAAWNLERCYNVEKSAAVLRREGAELVLLSEVDNGMARTGQRHTSRDVAAELGMNYAFGVEFLELELGAEVELEFCKDDFNRHGFHLDV